MMPSTSSTLPAVMWSSLKSRELVEGADRVAKAALGVARDLEQRGLVDGDALAGGDAREHGDDLRRQRPVKVESLAAREDRRRDLVGLGRGEDEDDVRRRLFERLEERVERLRREHVDFVDDVDLVRAPDGREARRFSRSSRMSSMPRLEAPSISMTSSDVPAVIARQESHSLQGVGGRALSRS